MALIILLLSHYNCSQHLVTVDSPSPEIVHLILSTTEELPMGGCLGGPHKMAASLTVIHLAK